VTETGALPVALNVTVAVQVPQVELLSRKDSESGVVKLLVLSGVSQKGTPERLYVKTDVPDVVTWIDCAWSLFKATVVELTINCDCARPGTAMSSAVARNKAVFFSSF
jgi:hypothetical protein